MDSQIKTIKRDQGKILEIANTQINLNDGKYKNKYHHTSIRFESPLNSNFLQMADMVAYNTWRQFVEYGDEWDRHDDEDEHRIFPAYPYFERISNRFWHNMESGKVRGYGIAKIPDPFNGNRG